jgi:uncharacterized membrane protein YwaF
MLHFAHLLVSKAQWAPVLALVAGLSLGLRPGLALLTLLGAVLAAGGMAGVLLTETLLFVISVPQARSLAAFLGPWPVALPLLCGAACALPVVLRWRPPTRWEAPDALLAGAALFLLGTAWRHPLPLPPR